MTLIELINKYLKDNNLTKKEFTESIGMNPTYCRNVLSGCHKLTPLFIKRLESNKELYKDLCKYYSGKRKRPLKPKEQVIRERNEQSNRSHVYY